MRVILFTGKGGVGKTTTAAATAVQAARQGIKTLVMSTDAAHSLGDALGVDLSMAADHLDPAVDPVVEVEPGLYALQLSTAHSVRRSWRSVQDYLLTVLSSLGVDPVVAEEMTELPGADEIVALLELRTQVESGPWDLVIVDCAPTAETLRLLALPEVLGLAPRQAHAGAAGSLAKAAPRGCSSSRAPTAGAAGGGVLASVARGPAGHSVDPHRRDKLRSSGPHPRARGHCRVAADADLLEALWLCG